MRVSKYHSLIKTGGLCGKLVDSRTELVKIHDELLVVPVKEEMHTHTGTHTHVENLFKRKKNKDWDKVIGGNLKRPSG